MVCLFCSFLLSFLIDVQYILLELWNRNLLHLCMEQIEIELRFDEIYGIDARRINYLLLLVLHTFINAFY